MIYLHRKLFEFIYDILPSYKNQGGYDLLGHTGRRALLDESNEFVGYKVAYALSQGLKVIVCVGRIMEQREIDSTMDVVAVRTQAIPLGLITMCSESKQLKDLQRIQDSFMRLFRSDIEINHQLIEMFLKCGNVGDACIAFDRIVSFVI